MKRTNQLLITCLITIVCFSSCGKKKRGNDAPEISTADEKIEQVEEEVSSRRGRSSQEQGSTTTSPKEETEVVKKQPEAPQPKPVQFEIPEGTEIAVAPLQEINTSVQKTGQSVPMIVQQSIIVDGTTVVQEGTRANAKIILAETQSTMGGRSRLQMKLTSFEIEGERIAVVSDTYATESKSNSGKTAKKAGAGAAVGAGIGAIAAKDGKGGKGAGIGAAVGAAAGTGAAALQDKEPIIVSTSTQLTFGLQEPSRVTLMM